MKDVPRAAKSSRPPAGAVNARLRFRGASWLAPDSIGISRLDRTYHPGIQVQRAVIVPNGRLKLAKLLIALRRVRRLGRPRFWFIKTVCFWISYTRCQATQDQDG